jgi:hypothetical protein
MWKLIGKEWKNFPGDDPDTTSKKPNQITATIVTSEEPQKEKKKSKKKATKE